MPLLLVGDLQGCAGKFDQLLAQIPPGSHDRLWQLGDIVNRGPDSAAAIRTLMKRDGANALLGNHDLALLALAAGARKPKRDDTMQEVLSAGDGAELIAWLRNRPLAVFEEGHLLVHAGVEPRWSVEDTLERAAEVQAALRSDGWTDFMHHLYGDQPRQWEDRLTGWDRLRVIVNILTRTRYCSPNGELDLAAKEGIGAAPTGKVPWFDLPERATAGVTIAFGHWSTLGLLNRPNLLGLDTGCVWGGKLTACVTAQDWTQRRFFDVGCIHS
jgi:bis(5'-nucleosyl)-tetraphosphatase (symmetrical)